MSNIIARRKSAFFRIGLTLMLILLLSSIAIPVGAAPSEDLDFVFDVTYYDVPTLDGSGRWSSAGLFASSGDQTETYHDSGFDPERCWRTVHITSILTGPMSQDAITIRLQTVRV